MSFLSDPVSNAAAITTHDSDELPSTTHGIYVGGAGNITLITTKGQTVLFTAVPVGLIIPIRAKVVMATGTTATNLVALW